MTIQLRQARAADVPTMLALRLRVRENRLSEPGSIVAESFREYLDAGTVWIAEADARVVGFAALDVSRASVWALFVDPDAEGTGVGRALHSKLIEAAKEQRFGRLTLTTSPGTRAERFYRTSGWTVAGSTESGELRMERLV